MPKPSTRTNWTTDTCTAFLMSLRFHGNAKRAAGEIGRSLATAYKLRDRDPDFAARWDAMLAEGRAAGIAKYDRQKSARDAADRAMPNRTRFDGLTPRRQRSFLRALTETGNYDDACRRVKLSRTAMFNMRQRYPDFATACDRALGRSVSTLEQAAIDRAVDGVEEPVWHAGKIVGHRVVRSDPLLRTMLDREGGQVRAPKTKAARVDAAKEAAKLAGGAFVAGTLRTEEEVFQSIVHKLDRLAARYRRDEAARAVVWLAEGRIP